MPASPLLFFRKHGVSSTKKREILTIPIPGEFRDSLLHLQAMKGWICPSQRSINIHLLSFRIPPLLPDTFVKKGTMSKVDMKEQERYC